LAKFAGTFSQLAACASAFQPVVAKRVLETVIAHLASDSDNDYAMNDSIIVRASAQCMVVKKHQGVIPYHRGNLSNLKTCN
jgi:hypothetical protein